MNRIPDVIVALDFPDPETAWALVERLPAGTWYKVGLELFTRAGPPIVERLVSEGRNVFLDLKLHDIPNTVAGAVRIRIATWSRGCSRCTRLEANRCCERPHMRPPNTLMVSGAGDRTDRLRLLAITVLTSLDDAALSAVIGPGASVEETVGRLAGLARESGIDGAVSSVNECRAIKLACGDEFLVVTPGIRLAGQGTQDQLRVATPATARAAGADFLVVGRTITRAADPVEALERVRAALLD